MEKKLTEKRKINVLKGMNFVDTPKSNFEMDPEKNRLFGVLDRDRQKIKNSLKLKKLMF